MKTKEGGYTMIGQREKVGLQDHDQFPETPATTCSVFDAACAVSERLEPLLDPFWLARTVPFSGKINQLDKSALTILVD